MIVIDGTDLYADAAGNVSRNDPNAYVGQQVYDVSTGKDYIVTDIELNWVATLEEVEE